MCSCALPESFTFMHMCLYVFFVSRRGITCIHERLRELRVSVRVPALCLQNASQSQSKETLHGGEVSDSLQMFQPQLSEGCLPLPQLTRYQIVSVVLTVAATQCDWRLGKTGLGDYSQKSVCLCPRSCSHAHVAKETRTKQYSIACNNESADSGLWCVPQVQKAQGDLGKGIPDMTFHLLHNF